MSEEQEEIIRQEQEYGLEEPDDDFRDEQEQTIREEQEIGMDILRGDHE